METNPPADCAIYKTPKPENIRIKKTFSFRKKIRIGNLARKTLKWILFLGIPLIIITTLFYYFFIFLSSKSIFLRSINDIKNVDSAKYSAEINLDFSNTSGSKTSKEFSAESNILK